VAAFIAILSIISFALGEVYSIILFTFSRFTEYKELTVLVTIWLVTSTVCDLGVTILVAWTLYTSRTGFKQTDALLARLILWTVNTGALTASFALLGAVTFIVKNESLVHLAANIVLAKLYSNTLLASLNRRGTLSKGKQGALHFADNKALSHVGLRRNHSQGSSSEAGLRPLLSLKKNKDGPRQIQITVTTHQY